MKPGLDGLFGHTYIDDEENPGQRIIQYQFRVLREVKGGRYLIQYFSFLDGFPTTVGVVTEAELLSPNVKLYATRELWLSAYELRSL